MFRSAQFDGVGNDARRRVRGAGFSLVLGLALLAGCDRRPETGRERLERWEYEHSPAAVMQLRTCERLPEPRPEWPRHDLRLFSLQAPPEFRYEKHQGIDSFVGRFHAPGRVIGFDYGKFSGALVGWHTAAEFRACSMFIDGHVAKIVTARYPDGRYFAGAAWRELTPDGQIHLTIDGASESPAGHREMLAIFRSVRLTPPGGPH